MGQLPARYEGTEKFHQFLSTYETCDLRSVYEYLTSEFIHIVQSLETKILLEDLAAWKIIDVKKYEQMRNDLGPFVFAEKMVQDISDQGREAIMAFWECLYVLCNDFLSSISRSLMLEIQSPGDAFMQQIHLDKCGHSLSPELKDIQEHHKQRLLEYAENAVDNGASTSPHEKHHGGHRMDMMVLYADHFRRRSQHHFLESGVKHESYLLKNVQSLGEFLSLDRLFRWSCQVKSPPHSVMITGAPGVGKTTLIKKFVCDWANGKIYQRFSFVFFFRFQDLNRLDKISLEMMIFQLYPYLQIRLTSILQFPEKILFIFDGFDESIHQVDFSTRELCSNVSQVEDVGLLVVSLVKQSLLKGCSVLMTSKTSRVAQKVNHAFARTVEIMGFNPIAKEICFQNFFEEKTLSDQVFSYVKDNGALYNFCFNPTFCRIICEVFSMNFKAQPMNDQNFSSLPKTVTQLLAGFLSTILSSHRQDIGHIRKLLASIGLMAGHRLSNKIIAFNEQILSKFKIDATCELLQHFMLKYGHPPNVTFSFLHLLLPEFLAALVHYINYSPEKLYGSLENANSYEDCHHEMFLAFLCGLSDRSTRSILQPYLGKLSSRAITRAVKCVSEWLVQQATKEVQKLDESRYDKRRCLTVFYYLYESQNKDLVRKVFGSCRRLNLSSVLLTPLDLEVLSFIFDSCQDTEELHLSACRFDTDRLGKLTPRLHHLKAIRLRYSYLTDISCIYLASVIRNNPSLKILDLSHNRLSGPHFSDLMDALSSPACSIEELDLDSSWLQETSCIQLASGIRSNQSLRKLNLSRNYLIGAYFGDLVDALSSPSCRIEELGFCDLCLRDEYAPLLVPLSNNTRLTHLDLNRNSLSDASVCHIRELALKSPSLKEICLMLNRITNVNIHKPGLTVWY